MTSDITQPQVTRRQFLQTATAAAAVAPLIIPASVLGAAGKPPPSGRINLGIIGCGGMGRHHEQETGGVAAQQAGCLLRVAHGPSIAATPAARAWPHPKTGAAACQHPP